MSSPSTLSFNLSSEYICYHVDTDELRVFGPVTLAAFYADMKDAGWELICEL